MQQSDEMASGTKSEKEDALIEFGKASVETRGTPLGSHWDSGFGTRPP